MERFTKKCYTNLTGYIVDEKDEMFAKIKLGEHEDIEEELGIDLITLFEAKNKCFCKIDDKVYEGYVDEIYLTKKQIGFVSGDNDFFELFFSDYGKSWALTKEELL